MINIIRVDNGRTKCISIRVATKCAPFAMEIGALNNRTADFVLMILVIMMLCLHSKTTLRFMDMQLCRIID